MARNQSQSDAEYATGDARDGNRPPSSCRTGGIARPQRRWKCGRQCCHILRLSAKLALFRPVSRPIKCLRARREKPIILALFGLWALFNYLCTVCQKKRNVARKRSIPNVAFLLTHTVVKRKKRSHFFRVWEIQRKSSEFFFVSFQYLRREHVRLCSALMHASKR